MERLAKKAERMLTGTILPFWMGLRDDAAGGYYGYMDFDLAVDKTADKGCILNSRILWFFSEAALALGREDVALEADHAYDFLTEHCMDGTFGGVYWSVHADGSPADTTKHTYNQAFAVYALSAYSRLCRVRAPARAAQALAQARALFELIEARCTDGEGYLEAFTRAWQPASNEKLSENGVLADKTMNTLLHVFEGWSGLYAAAPDPAVEKAMRRILAIYAGRVYDPQKHRQNVFFDAHYRSLLDLHSYGHDIESSWLIDWGTRLLGDDALTAKIAAIDDDLAAEIYRTAYRNHSLCNECDRGVVDTTRVWWVQAEAVLGFVNALEKHPAHTEYAAAAADVWHYIETVLKDSRPGGEWFWDADENGVPASRKPIVEPWKCPYHNGRMCLELMRRDPDVEA